MIFQKIEKYIFLNYPHILWLLISCFHLGAKGEWSQIPLITYGLQVPYWSQLWQVDVIFKNKID
jgi:hypothetical protein